LWTDEGPHIVDFDDARMAPAVQDIWMFLSGDRTEMTVGLDAVLAGYTEFCDFDARELHLIEALRTLRLIHYYGWLARRWDDPAFKRAFPWFNTQRSWEEHILNLREQAGSLHEPPLQWFG
jgi:Ser/Thr protein kinase RdoA (MazF antagonist)